MDHDRYLQLIEHDGTRLGAAARHADLAAAIPSCPGWTVGDCVAHTAEVYQHKVACMRLGRSPGDDYEQRPPDGVDLLDWFDGSLALLLSELRARGPGAPAYTWWPPDQTVGFWYRRMAQETAVHRWDAQEATGEPEPIDAALAADGIDELIDVFVDGPPDLATDGAPVLGLRAADTGASWTIAVTASGVLRVDGPATDTVTATAGELLLILWGRRRPDLVDGDGAALAAWDEIARFD
jgi:uncharacterized protein (TIGR03083 family)